MKVAVDAVGIRGHGGAAVLCEYVKWLPIVRPKWQFHVFLLNRNLREFDLPPLSERVVVEETTDGDSGLARIWWVNRILPKRVKSIKADVLFSFANMAPKSATLPQVVFWHQANAMCESFNNLPLTDRFRMSILRGQILSGARACSAVIVQTQAMADAMVKINQCLKDRIHVVPSGCRSLSGALTIGEELRRVCNQASHPRLIYVTHPGHSKNHVNLVRALALVVQQYPEARLMLSIDRNRTDSDLYVSLVKEIEEDARSLGVLDRIVWLGILNAEEVHFALSNSDLMVFPSLSESFGLGLAEAMMADCPVLVSDLPYAHDVCGTAAVYFDPGKPACIAESILAVYGNRDLSRSLLAQGAKQRVKFQYRTIIEKVSSIIEGVADRSASF